MKKLITLAILCCLLKAGAQNIPSTFYGINHWMPHEYLNHTSIPYGFADYPPTQTLVKDAGVTFYRIGGTGYDSLATKIEADSATNDYIMAMKKVRLINPNAKFLIQVPFKCGFFTADSAAKLVTNIAAKFNNERGFYYSIGNEWDKYKNPATDSAYSIREIKNIIKSFAIKMKNADSSIFIVAPALSFLKATDSTHSKMIMPGLLGMYSSPDSLNQIINGTGLGTVDGLKYYIDAVDFHFYDGSYGYLDTLTTTNYTSTRNGIINSPYSGGFKKNLDSIQKWLHHANLVRPNHPLTFAITEMNVCLANPTTIVTGDTTTNITEGIACRSFFAGQAWADVMSSTLASTTTTGNAKCEFIMPWSIHESNGDGSIYDHSMTKDNVNSTTAPTPLSTYYHYNLMSQYINANYYSGISSISPNVKTFASIDTSTNFIYVMLLNRNNTDYTYNIGFSGSDDTASATLKLHFPFNTIYTMDTTAYPYPLAIDTLRGNSTVLLQFNCHGAFIMKKTYSLADAVNNDPPAITQVGNIPVDVKAMNRNLIDCGHPGGTRIGGTISTNTSYLGDTLYVTSDINVTGSSELTFVGCLVIVSPGLKISSGNHASIVLLNTIMVGCEGKTWKGIQMLGNYYNTERLHVTNSVILNAEIPLGTDKIADIAITHSVLANGTTTAINLNASQAFSITQNLIAGFKTGITTTHTVKDYVSEIKDNRIIEVEDAMKFTSDEHNKLDIWCNEMWYTGKGITTTSTTLQTQGSSGTSAQNKFTKTVPDIYLNYLDISGSSPSYYYGPSETVRFSKPYISNITTTLASADRTCYHTFMEDCTPVTTVGITEQPNKLTPQILVYPNPNSGTFTISFSNLTRGLWTLNVYDMLGKLVSTNKVEADSKTTTLQIFTKGLYFVSLQNGNNRITQKVIVD